MGLLDAQNCNFDPKFPKSEGFLTSNVEFSKNSFRQAKIGLRQLPMPRRHGSLFAEA